MRFRLATFAAAALASQAACSTPCQELGARICACQPQGTLRDNCNALVGAQLDAQNPKAADERFCQERLAACPNTESSKQKEAEAACAQLATADGKAKCGLAVCDPAATTCNGN